MLTLDHPTPEDWPAIGALANEAVRHMHNAPVQAEWLENRRAYSGRRHQVLAREDGELVGYGAVETRDSRHRLFLVVSWSRSNAAAVADALMEALRRDRSDPGPVVMLEYADDTPFLDYLQTRGFTIAGTFEHEGIPTMRLVCAAW